MSRHSYLQEQLLYQPQHPVNLKRLRQQAAALPIYARSYSLEEQQLAQAQAQAQFVPVYNKFIYPHESLNPIYTHDSLNSLSSDYTDYDYETSAGFIVEQAVPPPVASTNVVQNLNALGRLLELLQRLPLPCLSFNTACICSLIMIFIAPRSCAQTLLFPAFRLFFGTLYPAYASYKAVRTKNVKEYVKWMMYWIVFAFFTCIETFTDIFLAWFPFYYEIKVVIVLWLLSPATKGSSTLYRKFVHPMLTRREQEIDEYLNQARERGYSAVLQLGSKGVNYATNVIMQTAIKTIQMASSSATEVRGLQGSQSANNLSGSRDMLDASDLLLPRSSSLTVLESFTDQQRMIITELDEGAVDAGAARLRDLPVRKTRNVRAAGVERLTTKRSTRGSSRNHEVESLPAAVSRKPRRGLREATPDVDVEAD
ncbi:receptor expression-enhancing protein 2 isoform X4 [Drosophila busckii]|uniref:receptor expression-enhancing protein 2 isoform X4 n=1 Tax=Drosophila busckii TaxID=30019 RepID=UPI00083F1151|nr:receptor expression-enhancing protein 2 isoform X4 [Drosophila busckii]